MADIVESGKRSIKEVSTKTEAKANKSIIGKAFDYIKGKISEVTQYSKEITKHIRSEAELKVYQSEGLKEGKINDKPCLKADIDLNLKDARGRTNLERMERGLAPISKTFVDKILFRNGEIITLHHIGQDVNSPLAELKDSVHKGKYDILHDRNKKSNINREAFSKERAAHWKARAREYKRR